MVRCVVFCEGVNSRAKLDLWRYHGTLFTCWCSTRPWGGADANPAWRTVRKCSWYIRFTKGHSHCGNRQPPCGQEVFKAFWSVRSIPYCHRCVPCFYWVWTLSSRIVVMCPDKKLEWFDPDQAAVVDQLVQQWWSDTYKSSPHAEVSSQPDGSPVKVCYPNLLYPYGPEKKFRRCRTRE